MQRVGSNTVNAALLGQMIPFAVPGKDDTFGGFGRLGMEFRNANVAVFASGECLWLSDCDQRQGRRARLVLMVAPDRVNPGEIQESPNRERNGLSTYFACSDLLISLPVQNY
ncbi:hypothetical protein [Rhodoplanes sp. Z2-YC6860]|uniref:hypothetical protein n=1 Tax=Rhodoplanes sp. Z2-YC6860 TaxID=674703 RepID=UPI0012EDB3A6|nr:hypothetical protein [Rhodoplanes sp. Z2-YC6860]